MKELVDSVVDAPSASSLVPAASEEDCRIDDTNSPLFVKQ
jgi:hypothetical protein